MILETLDTLAPEKPYTLFIADLHLSPKTVQINELFKQLTGSKVAHEAESFYILGDLFDFWLGDDLLDHPEYAIFANQLASIAESGVKCYFQIGNRDFLIDQRFYDETGFQPIDDPVMIDLYGTPTLLTHGDLLCSMDMMYQMFRKMVRMPDKRKAFLSLPMEQRIATYKRFSSVIGMTKSQKSAKVMDVDPSTVNQYRNSLKADWVIHGHTHLPGIKTEEKRIIIPDWRETEAGALGGLLVVSPNERTLHLFN